MAKPAADRATPAQPPSDEAAAKRPPPSERGKEDRLEGVERKEVTLESLEREVEELVGQAESGKADFDATREQVLERIRSYGGDLTGDERAKLDGLKTRAESRVRDLKVKALETRIAGIKKAQGGGDAVLGDSGRGAATSILTQLEAELAALKKEAAPAEAAAADSEEVAALKRRIENIKRAQGETAGGEHYRGPQAAILKDLEAQLVALQAKEKGEATPPTEEAKPEEPTVGGTAETTPTETAPTTPETESARPMPSARELMSIAKIRAQHWDNPEALKAAMEQAKYAESKGVLETGVTREPLIELMKTLGGREGDQALRGPALERLAKEMGVEPAQLEAAFDRQQAALEQRAREEVKRESRAGLKGVVAKGAAYVGLGAILNRFLPGWGALTAGVRIVETWRQGGVEEKKVQEKLAQFQKQIEEGDLRDPKALASELLRDLAADVASTKRTQIDGQTVIHDAESLEISAAHCRTQVKEHLQERYPNLSAEQRKELIRASGALFLMDHANATLEAKVAAQQPNGFRKLVATLDKVLGSKVLRGGETTREKMLTTVVFAAAGAMARELPIIRNILFAYTGFKAGEMLAQGITKRAGRYEVLKPVAAAALAGETVEKGVLDRARSQLLDAEFRKKSPAEYQQLREALERHELALLGKAESATDFVASRTDAMEATLAAKRTKEQERQSIVNSARIAGALAGAVLGPMAVEWIAKKFQPEPTTAPPEAVAPVEPEVDPRMEMVGTRQAGDGWTHIRARQFYALEHPELSGDQIVAKMEAHKQMLAELRAAHGYKYAANPRHWDDRAFSLKYIELAKADAMANGVLAPDGRTTLVSLRGEGVLPIDPLGEQQLAPKGDLQFYATKAKFGFEPTRPVAGTETTTGDIRFLDAGDTAMSEEDYATWLREHPGSQLAEVRPGGGAGRWATVEVLGAGDEKTSIRVPASGGGTFEAGFRTAATAERAAQDMTGTVEQDLTALQRFMAPGARPAGSEVRTAVAEAEEHLQAARDRLAEMKRVSGYMPENEKLEDTIRLQERALADAKRELVGARLLPAEGAAEAAVDAGGEVARAPEFVKAWENIFRGDRSTADRLAQLTAYLKERTFSAMGGRTQFKLDSGNPVYSTNGGVTFQPMTEKVVRLLVEEQGREDKLMAAGS